MKLLYIKLPLFGLFWFLNSNNLTAQITISQDQKFEYLLSEKRKINTSVTNTDKFKIQIFYGENQQARKMLNQFKQAYKDLDGTIVFSSPNYKVLVGSFRNRIDADRTRLEIIKEYPNALVVRPSIR